MLNGKSILITGGTGSFGKRFIKRILDEYSEKGTSIQVEEVTSYLNEFYGKPNKENLKKWLTKEFEIR